MDKSSHYINMCENAEAIQKQWNPDLGDFFVSLSLGLTSPCQPIASDLEKKVSYLKTIKAVWLPRQDQLQNILMADNASYFDKFDSMEKLWLAFIMFEKYKKKWKNGEWD